MAAICWKEVIKIVCDLPNLSIIFLAYVNHRPDNRFPMYN
jgi:hypothetical protein